MRWIKDQKVEANLRALGIAFETQQVPLKKVDLAEGIRRQARLINKLNEDQVLTMAVDMAKPDAAFPMPILQRPPHGALMWTWSGNHRLAAFTLTYPETEYIDAYIVTISDPVMLDLLPRVVNAWESQMGFSKEEKIANALWMIDKHSMAPVDAARHFGLKVNWLYTANQVDETKKAVMDIPKADKIAKSILRKLHPLMDNTNVLRSTVRLIVQHDVKSDEAVHIISDVKAQNTENQRLGELGRWEKILVARKEPKKRVKGTVDMQRDIRKVFLRHITSLAKVLQGKDSLTQLQITDPADLSVAERAWKDIKTGMDRVALGGAK